jgi:hypothetical protein
MFFFRALLSKKEKKMPKIVVKLAFELKRIYGGLVLQTTMISVKRNDAKK